MLWLVFIVLLSALTIVCSSKSDDIWQLTLLPKDDLTQPRCLDGSQGGFWFSPGYGSGKDKFIIHHQGGGWCISPENCVSRSQGYLGSSKTWETAPNCDEGSTSQPCKTDEGDHGMLSRDPLVNPITHNWNRVYIGYCDGGSYSGQLQDGLLVNGTTLYFRGKYILSSIYDLLLSSSDFSMYKASEIIISGTSAGGLSVYLHVDQLVDQIQTFAKKTGVAKKQKIVGVPDAGFFMDVPSINGDYLYTPNYQAVYAMQNISDNVNKGCLDFYSKTKEEWKCFMAPYTLPFVQTPLFIPNSLVDSWQGSNIMGITCDPLTAGSCSDDVFVYLDNFRQQMISNTSMADFIKKPHAGAWLVECYTHCLLDSDRYYGEVQVQQQSMMQTLANWYYNRDGGVKVVIDGVWGNNTC